MVYLILPLATDIFGETLSGLVLRLSLIVYILCCMSVIFIGYLTVTRCVSGKVFSYGTAKLLMRASAIAIISSIAFALVNLSSVYWFEFKLDFLVVCRLAFAIIGIIVMSFGILLNVLASYVKDATEIKEELEGVI